MSIAGEYTTMLKGEMVVEAIPSSRLKTSEGTHRANMPIAIAVESVGNRPKTRQQDNSITQEAGDIYFAQSTDDKVQVVSETFFGTDSGHVQVAEHPYGNIQE